MGYMKINNLYKQKRILELKEVYALEKIHGTSAHIKYKEDQNSLIFYSGGAKHNEFIKLFNHDELYEKLSFLNHPEIIVYGEAYGGGLQKMSDVYGKELRFIVFDVKIGDCWLDVPSAEKIASDLNLEFVSYNLVSTNLDVLRKERDKPSVQAIRNGCGNDKQGEGVILRPVFEITMNNGCRLIAKYKTENFRETKTPRDVSEKDLKLLKDAQEIADEWATEMRLSHILGKIPEPHDISLVGQVIKQMVEDIKIEGDGEVELSRQAIKEINRRTAIMFRKRLESNL